MPRSVKTLCGYAAKCHKALGHMPRSVKTLCGICHKVSKSSAAYAVECQNALRLCRKVSKLSAAYAAECQNALRHMLQSVKKQCDKGFNALPLYFLACVKRFIALIFCLRYLFYRFNFFSA